MELVLGFLFVIIVVYLFVSYNFYNTIKQINIEINIIRDEITEIEHMELNEDINIETVFNSYIFEFIVI